MEPSVQLHTPVALHPKKRAHDAHWPSEWIGPIASLGATGVQFRKEICTW